MHPVRHPLKRTQRIRHTETAPGSRDGSGVGQHAQTTANLGKVTTRDTSGGLVTDTELESSRAPIYDLNRLPGFDSGNSRLDILWYDITTVK